MRLSMLAIITLALGLALDTGASAKMAQTITFSSTPPNQAVAGETYTASATSSSGANVSIVLVGVGCLNRVPNAEQHIGEIEQFSPIVDPSPSFVYFVRPGECEIRALAEGNSEYEQATVVQSFVVLPNPLERVTFTSSPPTHAIVGSDYKPTVTASPNLWMSFAVGPPSVCSINNGSLVLFGIGTCTIDAGQGSIPGAPAEAQQSFTVAGLEQTVSFTSAPPARAVAGESFLAAATTGAVLNPELTATGACSLSKPSSSIDQRLPQHIPIDQPAQAPQQSPQPVYLIESGPCTVIASQPGSQQYQPAAAVTQEFQVTKSPSEQITFSSRPPRHAATGETYEPVASSSAGLPVSFYSATPSVCAIRSFEPAKEEVSLRVRFIESGRCALDASQSDARYEPGEASPAHPEAQQSFKVRRSPRSTRAAQRGEGVPSATLIVRLYRESGLCPTHECRRLVEGGLVRIVRLGPTGEALTSTETSERTLHVLPGRYRVAWGAIEREVTVGLAQTQEITLEEIQE